MNYIDGYMIDYKWGRRVVQWTAWNAPGGSEDRLINARTTVVSRAETYNSPKRDMKAAAVRAPADWPAQAPTKSHRTITRTRSTGTAVIATDDKRHRNASV